ncbi:uncharacterized protein A1O9_00522 [Exophiala aquamarina CBS 119918]|uniref:VOC domain-containing protein n=1 Tax=Exophiala aquamarina CBS 119918 TaxID=1182545 RepID=A0A072PR00_9EURO|nr:uncharacterized protein A1O9_00522 [Exophiala aquamarina CBS 119918]KEF62549.1 hypothetical protein A1O9_00522 [Exophiala aquamarina CBS 119918]
MAGVQVRATRLAHVVYQHVDIDKALAFLIDFGFVEVERKGARIYLGGYGEQPFLYVLERSPDGEKHFGGGYWVVDSMEELKKAASYTGAMPIEDSDAPGGGKVVVIKDPNGFDCGFVYGQKLQERCGPATTLQVNESALNTVDEKPRKGSFRRFKKAPSPIHKLGHYGYGVPASKFESTYSWYMSVLNLKLSDTIFDKVTGKDESCFFHIDLGPEYTDHHVDVTNRDE